MSTWHQKQRPVRLSHDTQWTVVVDPPNECCAIARYGTEEGAVTYLANLEARGEKHAYILNPTRRLIP